MEIEGHEYVNCFLFLEWNFMLKSENAVDTHIENLYFECDYIVFQFENTKGYQKCEKYG